MNDMNANTRMTPKKDPEAGDGYITMFEAADRLAAQLPPDTKKLLSQAFFFLLACAEDKTLNLDKLASLMPKLTDGLMHFVGADRK